MTHFPLPLVGEVLEGGRRFKLLQPFKYIDPDYDIFVEIPAGFSSDWNSVPSILWTWFAPWEHPEAGLVHDWLYAHPEAYQRHYRGYGWRSPGWALTRQQADDVHRRILELDGVRWSKRQTIYLALRAGGWKPWNKYRAQPPDVVASSDEATRRKYGKQVNPGSR